MQKNKKWPLVPSKSIQKDMVVNDIIPDQQINRQDDTVRKNWRQSKMQPTKMNNSRLSLYYIVNSIVQYVGCYGNMT